MEGERAAVPPWVRVVSVEDLPGALELLGVPSGRAVLVVVGGAGGMAESAARAVEEFVEGQLVGVLQRRGAVVVDGGTEAGVMRVLGRVRRRMGGFVLLGVAATGTVVVPGAGPPGSDAAALDPGHSGVLLVPGERWGEESVWIARTASVVAAGAPTVTLVVNGGGVTYDDVEHSLREGRQVVVASGTGRTADEIARAVRGEPAPLRAGLIAASRLVQVADLDRPAILGRALEAALS